MKAVQAPKYELPEGAIRAGNIDHPHTGLCIGTDCAETVLTRVLARHPVLGLSRAALEWIERNVNGEGKCDCKSCDGRRELRQKAQQTLEALSKEKG